MKKVCIGIMAFLVTWVLFNLASSASPAEQDYKVIKKATSNEGKVGDPAWLLLKVANKKTGTEQVSLRLPFSLIEMIASQCNLEKMGKEHHCQLDLKTIIKALKECKGGSIIEVNTADELVKVWLE